MSMIQRAAQWLGIATRDDAPGATPPALMPPPRSLQLGPDAAIRISTVYRAVEVLAIGVSQLGLDQWRGNRRIPASPIIRKPDTRTHRSAFLEYSTVCLALDGNAYWRILRDPAGAPLALHPLNPYEVSPVTDPRTQAKSFHYRGQPLTEGDRLQGDVVHLQKLRTPGRDKGLGPIEAARRELTGAIQASDYTSGWFERGDVPSGLLVTDQELTPTQAKTYKDQWRGWNPETGKYEPDGVGVRVLGQGLKYDPLMIKPADLQFLETQQFNTTQIARLFGTPASLMLAVVEGNSQSYANVEQDWIAFTRFTLMGYIREMEEAFSAILPAGNTTRFNVDALQRSDTTTRYAAHAIGLDKGFLTLNEVREMEGLDPLADAPTPPLNEDQTDA